jgi:hypothetical protein
MSKVLPIIFCLVLCEMARAVERDPTVGMEGRIEITLPGTLLDAKPVSDKAPLIVRVASVTPFSDRARYDLRYVGLAPGDYDLRKFLVRRDQSSLDDLPAMPVRIGALLPADHDGALIAAQASTPFLGRYRTWLMIAIGAWLIALVVIVLLRRRRTQNRQVIEPPRPLTLADRLRPMLERASRGELSADEKATIERLLLNHWQHKLALTDVVPAHAMRSMREHPEAGVLLRSLENWFHRPPGTIVNEQPNLATLLEPYR